MVCPRRGFPEREDGDQAVSGVERGRADFCSHPECLEPMMGTVLALSANTRSRGTCGERRSLRGSRGGIQYGLGTGLGQ